MLVDREGERLGDIDLDISRFGTLPHGQAQGLIREFPDADIPDHGIDSGGGIFQRSGMQLPGRQQKRQHRLLDGIGIRSRRHSGSRLRHRACTVDRGQSGNNLPVVAQRLLARSVSALDAQQFVDDPFVADRAPQQVDKDENRRDHQHHDERAHESRLVPQRQDPERNRKAFGPRVENILPVAHVEDILPDGNIRIGGLVLHPERRPLPVVPFELPRILDIRSGDVVRDCEGEREIPRRRLEAHARGGIVVVGEVHVPGAEAEFAQQDVGIITRSFRPALFEVEQSVHAAEEEPSRIGALVVGVVAELPDLHPAAVIERVRGSVAGIELDEPLVGAQPQEPVLILEDSVDHVVDKTLLTPRIEGFDLLSVEAHPHKTGGSADQQVAVPRPAHAEHVVDRASGQFAQGVDPIVVGEEVEAHEPPVAAPQPENRVSFDDHRKEGRQLLLFVEETETAKAPGRDAVVVPLQAQPIESVPRRRIQRRVIGLVDLMDLFEAAPCGKIQMPQARFAVEVVIEPGGSGTDPEAVHETALLKRIDRKFGVVARIGPHALPFVGEKDLGLVGAHVLAVVEDAHQAVALGSEPQRAVRIGQDGTHLTREILRKVCREQVRRDGVAFHVHHGALAVDPDPENPLIGVLVQAEDPQVAVDDLLAVRLGGLQAHESVGAESDHQVVVEGADPHHRAVFAEQRRKVADVDLGLPPDIVDVEILVGVDEAEGLVVLAEQRFDGAVVEMSRREAHASVGAFAVEGVDREAADVARLRGIGEQPQFARTGDERLRAGIADPKSEVGDPDEALQSGVVVGHAVGAHEPRVAVGVRTEVEFGGEGVVGFHAAVVARKAVHTALRGDPQTVPVGTVDTENNIVVQRLGFGEVGAEDLHILAVEAVHAVVGTEPHQFVGILVDADHRTVREALLVVDFVEDVGVAAVLRSMGRRCGSAKQAPQPAEHNIQEVSARRRRAGAVVPSPAGIRPHIARTSTGNPVRINRMEGSERHCFAFISRLQ